MYALSPSKNTPTTFLTPRNISGSKTRTPLGEHLKLKLGVKKEKPEIVNKFSTSLFTHLFPSSKKGKKNSLIFFMNEPLYARLVLAGAYLQWALAQQYSSSQRKLRE